MEKPSLNDKNIYPDDAVLAVHLGNTKPVWDQFTGMIKEKYPSFMMEWNYYNDGKAWLCKTVQKKKTVCWVSIREGFFKTTFYFNQKGTEEVIKLDLDPVLKEQYLARDWIGKIKPFIVEVKLEKDLHRVQQLLDLKIRLK